MDDETLAAAPFKLDGAAIAWVRETFSALSPRDKLTQLFKLRSVGSDPAALDAIKAFKPGGVTRVPGADAAEEIAIIDGFHASADSASDLGRSRRQPDEPAVRDEVPTARTRRGQRRRGDAARSARSWPTRRMRLGINWVADAVHRHQRGVPQRDRRTRCIGSDVAAIEGLHAAQIAELQRAGVAATGSIGPARDTTTATSTSSPPSIRCRSRSGRRRSAGSIAPRSRPACSR